MYSRGMLGSCREKMFFNAISLRHGAAGGRLESNSHVSVQYRLQYRLCTRNRKLCREKMFFSTITLKGSSPQDGQPEGCSH